MSDESTDLTVFEAQEVSNVPMNIDRSEIDMQISTAHRFPRSITRFRQRAMEMALMDEDTAASCFYVLPRGGKSIEGPGVRMAEIVGSAWGNMRYGARVTNDDGKFITAQGMAFDLETNVAVTIEVRRKITDKHNKRYNDDMIANTGNAACSIALRNAIFKVVPKAFINPIYLAAKKAAVGDVQTLDARRHKMLEHFAKMGIQKERIFASVGAVGIEDIDLTKLEKLIGIATALKDGDTSPDEAFPTQQAITADLNSPKTRTEALANKLKVRDEADAGANG